MFEIGGQCVCIKDFEGEIEYYSGRAIYGGPKVGKVYTVTDIKPHPGGYDWVGLQLAEIGPNLFWDSPHFRPLIKDISPGEDEVTIQLIKVATREKELEDA